MNFDAYTNITGLISSVKHYQQNAKEKPIVGYNGYTIYSCTYDPWKDYPNIKRSYAKSIPIQTNCIEKNIYVPYDPKTDKLPYQTITLDTTPEDDIVYSIDIHFKENSFTTFDECENYMKNIIGTLKKQKKNLKYTERNMNDSGARRMWYYLDDGNHQVMVLACTGVYKKAKKEGFFDFLKKSKIDYISAEILYWDNKIKKMVKDNYERKEKEREMEKLNKKKKKEKLRDMNKNRSINLFY